MKYIYKITNITNSKSYVGQTKNLENRIKQHKTDSKRTDSYRGITPLYEDVRKIGWENFTVELLEVCEAKEANERESYWIKKYFYNSYNRSVYAITAHDPKFQARQIEPLKKATDKMKKKVQQFDMEGNFTAEYDGVREAGRITGCHHQTIQQVAKGNKYRKSAGGYIWKYSK